MAIAAICKMNNAHQEDSNSSSTSNNNKDDSNNNQPQPQPQAQPQPLPDDDRHEHDVVMPGFRFHPTEEELVEFYLRRKIEGKRFNVELITFLDLYRYDPWELPALAAIGEKEWYFYVPRDKKYRNGDRPNRVTTSGYWKATGADRMIKNENSRSIGLKKTLVFYSGKAPKGIRTSWIMNEYRLPIQDTERIQKTEISLCRVYKRAGVVDHPSLPRSLPIRGASSSKPSKIAQTARNQPETSNQQHLDRLIHANYGGGASLQNEGRIRETSQSSTTADRAVAVNPLSHLIDDDHTMKFLQSKHPSNSSLSQNCSTIFPGSSSSNTIDDLQKLVNIIAYQQQDSSVANNHETPQFSNNVVIPINLVSHFSTLHPHPQHHTQGGALIPGSSTAALPDRLWDWNVIPEGSKDYTSLFK